MWSRRRPRHAGPVEPAHTSPVLVEESLELSERLGVPVTVRLVDGQRWAYLALPMLPDADPGAFLT